MPSTAVVASYEHCSNNTNSKWWRDPCLRRNIYHLVGLYLAVVFVGYDGSLLTGLQAIPRWNEDFGYPTGNKLGVISMVAYLPQLIMPPFIEFSCKTVGRRRSAQLSCLISIIGACVQAFKPTYASFLACRAVLGIASALGLVSTSPMVQELSHPRYRGVVGSLYFCTYYLGSTMSGWITFGTLGWDSSWSWRLPCLFQAFAPLALFFHAFFVPESPRWLCARGREDDARRVLAESHANGDLEDELVAYEMDEIILALKHEQTGQGVSWAAFITSPGHRRRLGILLVIGAGSQLNGVGTISYYLSPILRMVGVTSGKQITAINGSLAVWNLFCAVSAALCIDLIKRRNLWLLSTGSMLLFYIFIMGLSAGYVETGSRNMGIAVIPMLYLTYGAYDVGWTIFPYSYATELLPYNLRVKGVGILSAVQGASLAFNQWVNPVALDAIAWKYYAVYIGVLAFLMIYIYFFFPETKGLTVEQTSMILDEPFSRKAQMAAFPAAFQRGAEAAPSTGYKNGDSRDSFGKK